MVIDISKQQDLEWIKLRQQLNDELPETLFDKGFRKMKKNPFVPIGCAATVAALSYGLWNFWQGNSRMSQYMMRARILAQGATFVAVIISISASIPKNDES